MPHGAHTSGPSAHVATAGAGQRSDSEAGSEGREGLFLDQGAEFPSLFGFRRAFRNLGLGIIVLQDALRHATLQLDSQIGLR